MWVRPYLQCRKARRFTPTGLPAGVCRSPLTGSFGNLSQHGHTVRLDTLPTQVRHAVEGRVTVIPVEYLDIAVLATAYRLIVHTYAPPVSQVTNAGTSTARITDTD